MYSGRDYLSCIKIPATKATSTQKHEKTEPMDFVAEQRDLVSVANRVFGEGKWNHTVISQTLDYVEAIGAKCCVGCVSFVRIQLENGNFHEDIGYCSTEESTKGLSIYNARVGSAVNALRRVLLSFGDKIERELHKLEKQTITELTKDVKKNNMQLLDNAQAPEKLNTPPTSVSHIPQTKQKDFELDKNKDIVPTSNSTNHPTIETKPLQNSKAIVHASPDRKEVIAQNNKTDTKDEQKSKQASSRDEAQRMERKRRQMEKQMEFKRRMMEKEGLMSNGNNKLNPKY